MARRLNHSCCSNVVDTTVFVNHVFLSKHLIVIEGLTIVDNCRTAIYVITELILICNNFYTHRITKEIKWRHEY